jgi:hypothetical protein
MPKHRVLQVSLDNPGRKRSAARGYQTLTPTVLTRNAQNYPAEKYNSCKVNAFFSTGQMSPDSLPQLSDEPE